MKITATMKQELITKLEDYLSGALTHDEIREFAWNLAEDSPKEPTKEENIYWSTVFSIIHLADDEHWNDGCTQKDLTDLCVKLKQT
ncbi:hypothetical protein [Kangiella sp.]|uniref:hypothetical protein n=1 Tax=Kangiella sp. TaxID=1920245 RepID=UPI003A9515E9